jgi:CDP-diacylglycerol--serine O-phosphatidyltransferase
MLIGRYNLPNAITIGGVAFAVIGCVCSYNGQLGQALSCLIAASICDLYDGVVARKMGSSTADRELGAQLDTIADVICYGITPMIILLHSGFDDPVAHGVMVLYVACAAMRLAYFNVVGTQKIGAHWYYTGLPVAYVAIVLPAEFILREHFPPAVFYCLLLGTIVLLALLYISKIRVPKQRGAFYVVFPLLGAGLAGYWLFT